MTKVFLCLDETLPLIRQALDDYASGKPEPLCDNAYDIIVDLLHQLGHEYTPPES